MKLIVFIILLFYSFPSFAQIREIDSLRTSLTKLATLPNYEADTNYLNTLNELSLKYQRHSPDSSIILARQSIMLCDEVNYERGKVEAMRNVGFATSIKGNYPQALAYYEEALKIA